MEKLIEKEFSHSVRLTERVYMQGNSQRVERILSDDNGDVVCSEDYPIASFRKGELGCIAGLVCRLSNLPANEDIPTETPRVNKRTSKVKTWQKIGMQLRDKWRKFLAFSRLPFLSADFLRLRFVILSDTLSASDYLNILAHIELFPRAVFLNPVELSTELTEGPSLFGVEMWRGKKLILRTELTREELDFLANGNGYSRQ